jgi:Caudovirus prohead protease.
MDHKTKNFALIKSGDDAGTISGYFSTYDRIPDSYGDIVAPGAFAETIKKREESGHPFPLCWNHDLDQIIGKIDKIEDTEKGPLMTASFLIPRWRRRSAKSSRAAWCISSPSRMTSWTPALLCWMKASRRGSCGSWISSRSPLSPSLPIPAPR